jgi:hypothetical protein
LILEPHRALHNWKKLQDALSRFEDRLVGRSYVTLYIPNELRNRITLPRSHVAMVAETF